MGREPRERVSQDALLNSQLTLLRGRVDSEVGLLRFGSHGKHGEQGDRLGSRDARRETLAQ